MQVLKPELRAGILSSAKELFYLNGYEKTTMRDVSDKMQMSVSNLYKYFKNKDDLFDVIVEDYATTFMKGFTMALSHSKSDEFDPERLEAMVSGFAKAISMDHRAFYILMEQSHGSHFQDFKKRCTALMKKHILSSVDRAAAKELTFIVNILVANLFTAFAAMAAEYGDSVQLKKAMKVLFLYHMAGFRALSH
jgi:AcrR family transcriptional regulator